MHGQKNIKTYIDVLLITYPLTCLYIHNGDGTIQS